MWGKTPDNRRANRRAGLHTADVLHVAAFNAKNNRNRILMLRKVIILLIALAGLMSLGTLALLGARSIGQYLFFQNDLFRLRACKIECNGDIITPKHIVEYLEINNCSNLFAFNMVEKRAMLLKKVPRIKGAEFARRLPGELTIIIHERQPEARLAMGAYYLAIDQEGYVLGTSSGTKSLPVISGHDLSGLRPGIQLDEKRITRALEVLKTSDVLPIGNYVKIKSIDVGNPEALEITLDNEGKVYLAWIGMDQPSAASLKNLETKLTKLAENLKSAAARGKKIISIDMTIENNFPSQEH